MQTKSTEDYLKAIYLLLEEQEGLPVSTSSLAARLGVANASVTGMLKRFSTADPQLVEYERYGGVRLTGAGEKIALEVIRHHRLIESFLTQTLGYSWDEVHEEAERLEHVISEEMEERIANALGHPTTDPHGDPIPDREGNVPSVETLPLTQLAEGQHGAIHRIAGQQPDLLRYLAGLGLTISASVQVTTKSPFNGPIHVCLEDRPEAGIALSRDLTDKIHVRLLPDIIKEK